MAEEIKKENPAAPAPVAEAKAKKKAGRAPAHGVVHIQCSFNNTIVTVTDDKGGTIVWSTSGSHGFKGTKKVHLLLPKLLAIKPQKRPLP